MLNLYQEDKTQAWLLAQAEKTCQLADSLIQLIWQTLSEEGDRLLFQQAAYPHYQEALDVAWAVKEWQEGHPADSLPLLGRLNIKERILYLAEQSRTQSLRQAMEENEIRALSDIPDSLRLREHDLRVDIRWYQQNLVDASDSLRPFLQQKLALLQHQHETLKVCLQENYPNYYEIKYQPYQVSIPKIQANLPVGTAMIEYALSRQYLYTLVVSDHQAHIQRQKISLDFTAQVDSFRRSIAVYEKLGELFCSVGLSLIPIIDCAYSGFHQE
ncbi:MAG: hypothetical protein HC880_19435 [Bacteroidia bacterium]|nr:hypothetical protein [Bacteroidia bacterium]